MAVHVENETNLIAVFAVRCYQTGNTLRCQFANTNEACNLVIMLSLLCTIIIYVRTMHPVIGSSDLSDVFKHHRTLCGPYNGQYLFTLNDLNLYHVQNNVQKGVMSILDQLMCKIMRNTSSVKCLAMVNWIYLPWLLCGRPSILVLMSVGCVLYVS